MNGAESLVHTLIASGIDTCFANPGTSEMHFVAALDRIPGIRCVLCLDESVVSGAADAYWRMSDKPAATLLHCGPGLANALSNLHNAQRARSGIVNIVGDQATYHRPLDAPLTADTEGWARPVSGFVRTAGTAARVGADAAAAITAAHTYPGQIATLILPADTAWTEGGTPAQAAAAAAATQATQAEISQAARILRSGEPTLLLLGGRSLRAEPLQDAARITQATGAQMLAETSNARVARGQGRVPIGRVPYPVDHAVHTLKDFKHIILVGAVRPVGFFAYPGKPGYLFPPDCTIHVLTRPDQDGPAALAALAHELNAPPISLPNPGPQPSPAKGAISPEAFAQSLAALIPEQCVIVDEAITFGRGFFPGTYAAPAHDWIALTGGAIGDGLPMATGAAIGAPGRRVIDLQADGSAMYSLAALWTQAREKLDVTTIIFSNRKYAILLGELAQVGANPGPTALNMLDLSNPDINWCQLANSLGVPAARATTMDEFNELLTQSTNHAGPFVIELMT
jgi:acetolactate synthase-1/2/3 large subunit